MTTVTQITAPNLTPFGLTVDGITDDGRLYGTYQEGSYYVWSSLDGFYSTYKPPGDFLVGDVNASGVEIGSVGTLGGYADQYKAAVLKGGVVTLLGTLPGDTFSSVSAINDNGVVVGNSASQFAGGITANRAFIWQNGTMTALGSLSANSYSYAFQINDLNQVAGWSYTVDPATDIETMQPFLWQNGTMIAITVPGDAISFSLGDKGQMLVSSGFPFGAENAYLWQNGKLTQLSGLAGYAATTAHNMNDQGEIVGSVSIPSETTVVQHAVLWQNGIIIDLNTLLPANSGWVLQSASLITDSGLIVGSGIYGGTNATFEIDIGAGLLTPTVAAIGAVTEFQTGLMTMAVAVSDFGGGITANLDALAPVAAAGLISGITVTDSVLIVTPQQIANDGAALNLVAATDTIEVQMTGRNIAIDGPVNHTVIAEFSGASSSYVISGADGVVTVTDNSQAGVTSVDQLSDVTALQFSDHTVIVAQTPGKDAMTSGNITELYAAILGREPDLAGLNYYQSYLQANPGTPLLQFAEWFLASPEYTAAHSYAADSAGDAQFITDSYQNLLHRTPSAAEIAYYQDTVMAPALAGLTFGTQAYNNADFQAHAQMLVYFSASPEFLTDVQITAAHPADAQHWLVLT